MADVQIVGAGPAGSAAALSALAEGAAVRIAEKSRAPKHKVCGEFIPAEAAVLLDELGAWQSFLQRFRAIVNTQLTSMASVVPGSWLYRLTRPQLLA